MRAVTNSFTCFVVVSSLSTNGKELVHETGELTRMT